MVERSCFDRRAVVVTDREGEVASLARAVLLTPLIGHLVKRRPEHRRRTDRRAARRRVAGRALGVVQTEQVLELIHHLRDQGMGVVVISHNLGNVFDVADRIVVLRLGRRVATFDRRTTSREAVVAAITGASAPEPDLQPVTA